MLDFMEGQIISKQPGSIVVQSGAIGFRVLVSGQTMDRLPAAGHQAMVYLHLHVREDELSLYGFLSQEERAFFNLLIQVSGIGPKLALGVLSAYAVPVLKKAILFGDDGPLTSISGIGKKTAQRLILELKDKIGKIPDQGMAGTAENLPSSVGTAAEDNHSQAIAALMALGYSTAEAYKALPTGHGASEATVEELIRAGLKQLARY